MKRRASAQSVFVRVCAGSVAWPESSQPAMPIDADSSDARPSTRASRVRRGSGGTSEVDEEEVEDKGRGCQGCVEMPETHLKIVSLWALRRYWGVGVFQLSSRSHGECSIWGQF